MIFSIILQKAQFQECADFKHPTGPSDIFLVSRCHSRCRWGAAGLPLARTSSSSAKVRPPLHLDCTWDSWLKVLRADCVKSNFLTVVLHHRGSKIACQSERRAVIWPNDYIFDEKKSHCNNTSKLKVVFLTQQHYINHICGPNICACTKTQNVFLQCTKYISSIHIAQNVFLVNTNCVSRIQTNFSSSVWTISWH